MYRYNITTREWSRNSALLAIGKGIAPPYSGMDAGLNNATFVKVHGVGPLPPGRYRIERSRKSAELGPLVFDLTPLSGEMYGRSLFRIHGDSIAHPGTASHGCIILDHTQRLELSRIIDVPSYHNDNDNILDVVAA